MFVYCECCVLSGRGPCDELITRPEESYRLWCLVVCDLETSRMRPWSALGRSATKERMFTAIFQVSAAVSMRPSPAWDAAFVGSWLMFLDSQTFPSSRVIQSEENAVNSWVLLYKGWCVGPSGVPGILLGQLDPLTIVRIGFPKRR
jgi:hypothetical protein